jgi:hypothetical protein
MTDPILLGPFDHLFSGPKCPSDLRDIPGTAIAADPVPVPDRLDHVSGTAQSTVMVVCKCGAGAHPDREGFCVKGHPLPGHGNKLSTTLHGLRKADQSLTDEGVALFEQSVTDAGGRDELTVRAVAQHRNRATVQSQIQKLSAALDTHGLFDRRGKLRVSWITKLVSLCNVALAIDRTLGLDRKARVVNFQERLSAAMQAKTEREK